MLRRLLLILTTLFAAAPLAAQPFTSDRITVTTQGTGPDVVLVPGLTSSPAAWKHVAADVPGYRYHFVQVKGFAGVPAEANAKGDLIKGSAEAVARYIAAAKLNKPAVVGHSMGGTIALMIGARHPALVSKVMVVDQVPWMGIFYGPPGTTPESVKPTADALRATTANAAPAEREKTITAMTNAMVATESERAGVIKSALDSDRTATGQAFHELLTTDLRPELTAIKVPATVLYVTPRGVPGLTDGIVDQVYRTSYANLSGVKLVRVPDAAHFIMYDNRPFFADQLKAFLSVR